MLVNSKIALRDICIVAGHEISGSQTSENHVKVFPWICLGAARKKEAERQVVEKEITDEYREAVFKNNWRKSGTHGWMMPYGAYKKPYKDGVYGDSRFIGLRSAPFCYFANDNAVKSKPEMVFGVKAEDGKYYGLVENNNGEENGERKSATPKMPKKKDVTETDVLEKVSHRHGQKLVETEWNNIRLQAIDRKVKELNSLITAPYADYERLTLNRDIHLQIEALEEIRLSIEASKRPEPDPAI